MRADVAAVGRMLAGTAAGERAEKQAGRVAVTVTSRLSVKETSVLEMRASLHIRCLCKLLRGLTAGVGVTICQMQ